MHRSRLQAVLVDQPSPTCDAALHLWRTALGGRTDEAKAPTYYDLGSAREVDVVVQRTGDDDLAGVHLDIETDDLAAEVARLEAAGAVVVEHVEDHVILRDPGGLRLCVVPVTDTVRFERTALTWQQEPPVAS